MLYTISMQPTLVPAGLPGPAGPLVRRIAELDRDGAAVWFTGPPRHADETAVAAAALAASSLVRIGVPIHPGGNLFWAARRIGTLSWLAGGRLDVVFVLDRPEREPAVLASLLLLRQLWTDPAFAERAWLRPAGDERIRPAVFGPRAAAVAEPLGLAWAQPEEASWLVS